MQDSKAVTRIYFRGVLEAYRGGGRGQWLGGTMASAEHEPKMGVWGQSPQRGPGTEPRPGQGVRGRSPPEAESILVMDVQLSRQI